MTESRQVVMTKKSRRRLQKDIVEIIKYPLTVLSANRLFISKQSFKGVNVPRRKTNNPGLK